MARSRSITSDFTSRKENERPLKPSRSIRFAENRRSLPGQTYLIRPHVSPQIDFNTDNAQTSMGRPPDYGSLILTAGNGTTEEFYGAQPSSYRRLKKARSLVNTKSHRERAFAAGNSTLQPSRTRSLRQAPSSTSLRAPSLRLRLTRSFHALRSYSRRPEQTIPYQPELTCRPESIALARSEFLKISTSSQASSPSSRTPQIVAPSSTRTLRQSVRSFNPASVIKDNLVSKIHDSTTPTKRSISASLRKKIKRILGKSTPPKEVLPPQQVDASHHHFAKDLDKSFFEDAFDNYCNDDPELSRRNSLYIPSESHLNCTNANDDQVNDIRSVKSSSTLRSKSQSRITSWTNSSASGSARGDLGEMKRLSIIREDGGPHQPSSSAGRHVGGLSVFQQPLQLTQGTQIDSQRIYSALVKRIDQEEAEVKRTEAALEEIHAAHNEKPHNSCSQLTVRRVSSRASSMGSSNRMEDMSPPQSDSCHQSNEGTAPISYCCNSRKRQSRQRPIEQPSTFFSSLVEARPQRPSPFRKLLRQKRSLNDAYTTATETDNVEICDHSRSQMFARSSESLYSRTTSGGTNMEYTSPLGSTEAFHIPHDQSHGFATIMYSHYAKPKQQRGDSGRAASAVSMSVSEKGKWRGWLEHQMVDLTGQRSRSKQHIREPAQIDPQDVELGRLKKFASVDLPSGWSAPNPSTPRRNGVARSPRSSGASALLLRKPRRKSFDTPGKTSVVLIQPMGDEALETKEVSSITCESSSSSLSSHGPAKEQAQLMRKISATRVASLLRLRKSQSMQSSRFDTSKENKPISATRCDRTPVSNLKSFEQQSSSFNIELRESSSNTKSDRFLNNNSPASHSIDADGQSLKDQSKAVLSARLSRPFDMDVPEYNRPFDSMYLGKLDRPSSENSRTARLSVASNVRPLRITKSYGGLGRPRLELTSTSPSPNLDPDPTALPQLSDDCSEKRTASAGSITNISRRMISDFLRRRRKDAQEVQASPEIARASSPAFI